MDQVSVENVPPNPLLIGEQFPEEGTTETYSFTWTDPGIFDTFSLVDANCGVLGTLSDLVFDGSTKSGSFKCYFADDDPSISSADPTTIHVEVDDDGRKYHVHDDGAVHYLDD